MSPDKDHAARLEMAETETRAQLEIVKALKPLGRDRALNVLRAVVYILQAEDLVPGILNVIRTNRKN